MSGTFKYYLFYENTLANLMSLFGKITKFFRKEIKDSDEKTDSGSEWEINIDDYIGKMVNQNGSDIGEIIAVEKNRMIIKKSDIFMAVHLASVVKNAETIAIGDFDREESLQLGKEWFERKDVMRFDEKGMLIKEE